MPPDLNTILDEAVELIGPPEDSVEAFRAQLTACIDIARHDHKATANMNTFRVAAMIENSGIFAPGILQRIGQDRHR